MTLKLIIININMKISLLVFSFLLIIYFDNVDVTLFKFKKIDLNVKRNPIIDLKKNKKPIYLFLKIFANPERYP